MSHPIWYPIGQIFQDIASYPETWIWWNRAQVRSDKILVTQWRHSGVQYWLTASQRPTRRPISYPGFLRCDVIKLEALKRKAWKICLHLLVIHWYQGARSKQDRGCCSGSCDFCLRAMLENGEVWHHITFVDVWLLRQLGLCVDAVGVLSRHWMPLIASRNTPVWRVLKKPHRWRCLRSPPACTGWHFATFCGVWLKVWCIYIDKNE